MELLGPPDGEEDQDVLQNDEAAHDDEDDRVGSEAAVVHDLAEFPGEVVVSGDEVIHGSRRF